jgi:methylenetetrahydrofolate reductase (NADPH)
MFAKEAFATYIVSQICFDPRITASWISAVWERGTRLPIYIGLPGPVARTKLLRISAQVGVGDSIRFLRKGSGWLRRSLSGSFDPDPLVTGLGASFGQEQPNVGGFHIFTFNQVANTERWRQQRLGSAAPAR